MIPTEAMPLQVDWSSLTAVSAARRLLGCKLTSTVAGEYVTGTIVETEAYDQTDAASHSFAGRTPRTDIMFGPAGHLYVYFTYGMHYCCNLVVGPAGVGAAVLIRALEPLDGQSIMQERRRRQPLTASTNGPAKLCQALGIDKALNGHNLSLPPVKLHVYPAVDEANIVQTTRVGITKAVDLPWRFYVRGNAFISKV